MSVGEVCHWKNDSSYWDYPVYVTDCGMEFMFNEFPPAECNVNYCQNCGRKMVEVDEDAEGLREDEGQVHRAGNVGEEGQGNGGEDLEQSEPGQPGHREAQEETIVGSLFGGSRRPHGSH